MNEVCYQIVVVIKKYETMMSLETSNFKLVCEQFKDNVLLKTVRLWFDFIIFLTWKKNKKVAQNFIF